ncbi:MAG: CoA transferase [Aldersonia sp.]|nr:CoA transferase [Aldersonia sp.]
MALTGRADGPPLPAPGDPAGAVRRALDRVADATRERTGAMATLPGVQLLGERAAIAGLGRRGPWSCGGAFRTLPTADGWIGLSLPREDDVALVPALVEAEADDAWGAVGAWALRSKSADAAERIELLGLPGGAVPAVPPADRSAVVVTEGAARQRLREFPRIVDLTSLWAGPLCAHLLGLGGAEVVKVESTRRPDGSRRGPTEFFDLLHYGHAMVVLDFHDPADVQRLRELLANADLVLEASRPRALRQLGVVAEDFVAEGISWLSITARGRASNAIGFGDDVAATAGLAAWSDGMPMPCGDALADPLAGVVAAAAASEALTATHARLIDVSMRHVAADAARGPVEPNLVLYEDDSWWVEAPSGRFPVAAPTARRAPEPAGALGADTARMLRTHR